VPKKVNGLPLIEKQDDCPRGGEHEDLPFVFRLILGEVESEELILFFCLKCHNAHWRIMPVKKDETPVSEPTTQDSNPLLDGVVHA
jgi:hypothetical protein